ncbi:MAG: hypothetical protein ACRYFU_03650 [Janthinobacterium lividum]
MNHLLVIGTFWSLIVATLSVGFAIFSHWRQVNASVYLDLTKQLHDLYKRIPSKNSGKERPAIDSQAAETLLLDFLHLMKAAFTLSKSGYFSGRLWRALQNDAKKGLRLPVFRAEWPRLKNEFLHDPAFIAFVDEAQRPDTQTR